ncbi:MAG TPA: hypothetical protein VNG33_19075 [Polyangiaceae bacterium]|nr:hypothetical protein [Polyangiaceae bacterium]
MQLVEQGGADGPQRLVFRGVKTCGSVHSCPMCAAAILRTRASELTVALDLVKRDRAAFVTFTLRHDREMALAALRKIEALAYSELKAGRTGGELKSSIGYVGDLKAAEQTYGHENGWHPHLHCVWVFDARPPSELETLLFERWVTCLKNAHRRLKDAIQFFVHNDGPIARRRKEKGEKYRPGELGTPAQRSFAMKMFGRRYVTSNDSLCNAALLFSHDLKTLGRLEDFLPLRERGVRAELVDNGTERLADYLAKLGLEVTGIASKTSAEGHFSSWDIAREAAKGRYKFVALWKEHGAVMKGARQLTWSRGLRDALGLEPERSDEELAEENLEPGETETMLGAIEGPLWDSSVANDDEQEVLAGLIKAHDTGPAALFSMVEPRTGEQLVRPRTGTRDLRKRQDVAPTVWEQWQRDAQARERGADRVKIRKERLRRCPGAEPRSMQRWNDSIEALREDLYFDFGIG